MSRYMLLNDGCEYSANADDYWYTPDETVLGDLIRLRHPWKTVTGQTVLAPRLLKRNATAADLRRLCRGCDAA